MTGWRRNLYDESTLNLTFFLLCHAVLADVGDNSIDEETGSNIERQLKRELYINADFGGKMHMRYVRLATL